MLSLSLSSFAFVLSCFCFRSVTYEEKKLSQHVERSIRTKPKPNEQNQTKRNETKRNETKRNETKEQKKRNQTPKQTSKCLNSNSRKPPSFPLTFRENTG